MPSVSPLSAAPIPATVITPTVAPADVSIAPRVSDKITAGLTYAAGTAVVAAAPLANQINPQINPHNVGGPEVGILGDGILVFVHALQPFKWFDRNRWGIVLIIILAFAVCIALWIHDDPVKGVLNGFATATKAFQAFGPLSKLGVLAGQTEPDIAAAAAITEVTP